MDRLPIFYHHIYELRKGLRNLILFTTSRDDDHLVAKKLEACGIAYAIFPVAKGSNKINVFFGAEVCVDLLRSFNKRRLSELTPEEDYILGIMLGYDRVKQCERYLRLKGREKTTKQDLLPIPLADAGGDR